MDTCVEMRQSIYLWLEQYSGVPYDFKEDINEVSGNKIFVNPYEWRQDIDMIIDQLGDAVECINDNGEMLPDSLPPKIVVTRFVVEDVLMSIIDVIDSIVDKLHLTHKSIKTIDELNKTVSYLSEFVEMMIENSMEDIIEENIFDTFNEDKDDIFDIHRNDLSTIHTAISSIRQSEITDDE